MSLFLNARFLTVPVTGVQRYAREITRHLPQLIPLSPARPGAATGHLWEQSRLLVKARNGVLWSPCNTGPVFHRRHAVTIHDLSPFDFPAGFTPAFQKWYRCLIPQLAKHAQTLLVPSQFSAERLQTVLKVPAHKIVIAPGAAASHFKPASAAEIAQFKKDRKINSAYVLVVGSDDPRKNLPLVGEIARCLEQEPNLTFLVAGGKADAVFAQSAELNRPNVRKLGYVEDSALASLFSGATALLAPSWYEGFGLPILEAMACGTPVIASEIPAFREVGGDAIVSCRLSAPQDWADAISDLLRHDSRRKELGERGLQRSRRFSWENSAAITLDALQKI